MARTTNFVCRGNFAVSLPTECQPGLGDEFPKRRQRVGKRMTLWQCATCTKTVDLRDVLNMV